MINFTKEYKKLFEYSGSPGLTKSRELLLNETFYSNMTVVEVGVFEGNFSVHLLEKNPKKLYLIDPWLNSDNSKDKHYLVEKGKLDQKLFDSIKFDVYKKFKNYDNVKIISMSSQKSVRLFQNKELDWVYLDARHYYNGILEDLNIWFPKIKINGFLCGDNFEFHGKHNYGIIQAVHEFCDSKKLLDRDKIYEFENKIVKIIGNQFYIKKI